MASTRASPPRARHAPAARERSAFDPADAGLLDEITRATALSPARGDRGPLLEWTSLMAATKRSLRFGGPGSQWAPYGPGMSRLSLIGCGQCNAFQRRSPCASVVGIHRRRPADTPLRRRIVVRKGQRPRSGRRTGSGARQTRLRTRSAHPGVWVCPGKTRWPGVLVGRARGAAECSTAKGSASLRRIARASAWSISAGSRSGCEGAYWRRSCSAGPRSAIRWMMVVCRARERAVYAHSRVNSSGRPIAVACSTVAPWLAWPVIA